MTNGSAPGSLRSGPSIPFVSSWTVWRSSKMNNFFTPLPFRKTLCFIFLFAGLFYVLLTSWANLWIGLHQEAFLKAMGEAADRPISAKKIQFALPNRLILRDVEFEST